MPTQSAATPPPRQLPCDIWLTVFAHIAGHVPTQDLLHFRLVCKQFSRIISSEEVAYRAVIAANRLIMRNSHGRLPRQAELPISWWSLLLDQVRLDRTWFSSGATQLPSEDAQGRSATSQSRRISGKDAIEPGYEIVFITHGPAQTSAGQTDELMFLDWVCPDVNSRADKGLIGYLAFRKAEIDESQGDLFVIVHIVDYSNLSQVASHALRHPGFLSNAIDPVDLPMLGINNEPLVIVDSLHVTLRHVDREHQTYLLAYGESDGRQGLLVQRSFREDVSRSTGKTLASFSFNGDVKTARVMPLDNGSHYRFTYTNPFKGNTHVHELDRSTLESREHHVFPCSAFYDSHMSDLLLLGDISDSGVVSLWNSTSGAGINWFCERMWDFNPLLHILRPMYRPGLFHEQPVIRPGACTPAPIHLQPEWVQVVTANDSRHIDDMSQRGRSRPWDQIDVNGFPAGPAQKAMNEHPFPNHARIQSTPRRGTTWNEIMVKYAPSAGQVAGHLLIAIQGRGVVSVIDLRQKGVEGKAHPQCLIDLMDDTVLAILAKSVEQQSDPESARDLDCYPLHAWELSGSQAQNVLQKQASATRAEAGTAAGAGDSDAVAGVLLDARAQDGSDEEEELSPYFPPPPFTDDEVEAPSPETLQEMSATNGQVVRLGERGDAFIVHCSSKYIAILRRRRDL